MLGAWKEMNGFAWPPDWVIFLPFLWDGPIAVGFRRSFWGKCREGCRLPIGDTADCQSALRGVGRLGGVLFGDSADWQSSVSRINNPLPELTARSWGKVWL